MSKIVLGTAAWGSVDYGLAKNRPGLRDIRCILKMAQENGITQVHYKTEYKNAYGVSDDVLALAKTYGMSIVTPPDYYKSDKLKAQMWQDHEVSVMYNALRQYILKDLRDYTGTVYARSIFLQGLLADIHIPSPKQYAAPLDRHRTMINGRAHELNISLAQYSLAGAFNQPYIDYLILGINSVPELIMALDAERSKTNIYFHPEHCLGEHDATDPRCWEVLRDRKPPVEPDDFRPPHQRTTRRMGTQHKSRG